MNELAKKVLQNEEERYRKNHKGGNFKAKNLNKLRDKLGRFKCKQSN